MPTLMDGLEAAVAAFRGVLLELLFDQLKAVVIAGERPVGGKRLENPEFLRVAAHWGFRLRAYRPHRARTKGKVNLPTYYLCESFLYGRELVGDCDLATQADAWYTGVANARVHGTAREVPRERFARDEQGALRHLAARPSRPLVLPSEGQRRLVPEPRIVSSRRLEVPAAVVPAAVVERRAVDLRYLRAARRGGRLIPAAKATAPSLRDRVRSQFAHLNMPGALEELDNPLPTGDGHTLTTGAALEALLGAQIALRNNRRL